ncbi:MAG: rhodanese-like domain-containing protein [Bacteroidetes bacterium]|nr:rhodanese-like domain-containing protein [Bacteroidota bacterium]
MENINPEELKARLDNGEKINLIDVREPAETAEYNIGGIAFPLGKIQSMQTEDLEPLKDEEVICYCRSGQRSQMAAMVLEQLGFTNVKNLKGGMLAWKEHLNS